MIEIFVEPIQEVSIDIESELVTVGDYEHYDGDYSVTPKFEQQKLQTKNKVMNFDVEVKEIPVERVANTSGGTTVIIG